MSRIRFGNPVRFQNGRKNPPKSGKQIYALKGVEVSVMNVGIKDTYMRTSAELTNKFMPCKAWRLY
ncbi:MAG TPA: hypothetical protein DDZ99_11525 [Clostridiales bacterium]|nr:hypothetical protein [Clostridiales bacterium]